MVMRGHLGHRLIDNALPGLHEVAQLIGFQVIDQRVVVVWRNTLADHDLLPGGLAEQLVLLPEYPAGAGEQVDAPQ